MRNLLHFTTTIRRRSLCLATVMASLCLGATISPAPSRAAAIAGEAGVSFLQAQLPAGTVLPQATYEQLTRAVGLATSAHRRDATSILAAALTRKTSEDPRSDDRPPCAWVARLLHVSVTAAPEAASNLMELASSLCPDCADALQTAMELFNDKNVVDHKNVVDGKNGPAAVAPPADPNSATSRDTAGLDGLIMDDPEIRNVGLYAAGFGPGFPGSPGFVGSPPGGNIALPRPISNPVTPVMND